ncbi:DUF7503 family protein [Halorussus limi]
MSVMPETEDITGWLAEHPRTMGALFTLILLLSQVGNVAAGSAGARFGP